GPQPAGDRVHGPQQRRQVLVGPGGGQRGVEPAELGADAEGRPLAGHHQRPEPAGEVAEDLDRLPHEVGVDGVAGLRPAQDEPADTALVPEIHAVGHGPHRSGARRLRPWASRHRRAAVGRAPPGRTAWPPPRWSWPHCGATWPPSSRPPARSSGWPTPSGASWSPSRTGPTTPARPPPSTPGSATWTPCTPTTARRSAPPTGRPAGAKWCGWPRPGCGTPPPGPTGTASAGGR